MNKPFLLLLFAVFFCSFLLSSPKATAQDTTTFNVMPAVTTVDSGDLFQVDITVENFNRVVGFQFAMTWDPRVMLHQQTLNKNSTLTTSGPFQTVLSNDSTFSVLWFTSSDFDGVSLPGGTVLFTLEFLAVGPPGSSTLIELDPSIDFEVTQNVGPPGSLDFEIVPAIFNEGLVEIFTPCGVKTLASANEAEYICQDSTASNDTVVVRLAYTGIDPNVSIISSGSGEIAGDDPALIEDGVIEIRGIREGEPWSILITGGDCNLTSTGTVPLGTCPPPPCGITDLETGNEVTISCLDSTIDNDSVIIFIAYAGLDPNAVVSSNGMGEVAGNNPAVDPNGVIELRGLTEGQSWNLTITGGSCDLTSTGVVPSDVCPAPPCGVTSIETGSEALISCLDSTTGVDQVTISISYVGIDSNIIVTNNGSGTVGGDDPASMPNGTIIISNITEGQSWNISLTGGNCSLTSAGIVPANACTPEPCGITDLETAGDVSIECVDSTAGADQVVISIDYIGLDSNATITNLGPGMVGGDDPSMTPNGTITISNITEGQSWNINITGGSCDLTSSGIVPVDYCPEPADCGVTDIETGTEVSFVCVSSTDTADFVTVFIDYSGVDGNISINNNGAGSVAGDNPAQVADGTIEITNIKEGESWNIQLTDGSGGVCDLLSSGIVPTDQCPDMTCGITSLETGVEVTIVCLDSTAGADQVRIEISYTGLDSNAVVTNNGTGNIGGDDPASTADGIIVITNITEGQSWNISITGGNCNLSSAGIITTIQCPEPAPTCGVTSLETGTEVTFICQSGSAGSSDLVDVFIDYVGVDPNAVVNNMGNGTLDGDDPSVTPNGTIILRDVQEGQSWNISITGGGCNLTSTGTVPSNQCGGTVVFDIDETTAQPGDTVCVDVYVRDFISVIGFEYDISWDNSILNFVGVSNINLTDLSPASFSEIGTDQLRVSWISLTSNLGVTLADSTIIYSMCFEVVGGQGQRSDLEFVTDVLVGKAGQPPVQETGTGLDGEVVIPGPPSSDVIITISDETAQPGDTVCVDVTVENFNGLIGLEYEVAWDIGILDFIEVRDINLPDLSPASFSLINDTLKLSWVSFTSPQGVNVPDGTRIYSICFEVLGSTGQRSDVEFVTNVNVAKAGTPPIQETGIGIDGEVQIEGAPSSDVIITISDETAQPGDTVCVDVTVENFNGLIGLEYEVAWDIGILDFIEVRDINLPDLSPASFSLINDTLKLSWVSFTSPQGVNVPDGTRIYSICFEVLGSTGQRSDVEFVTNVNVAKAGTPPIQETGIGIDGEVQIEGAPSSDVIITISDETAQPGDTVCVDVTVENFNGLIGLEYEVAWDIGILDFIEVRDINLPDLSPASFSLINDTLKLSWVSFTSPQGVNVPDGTRIYSICFEVLGSTGQRSDVEFVTNVNVAKAGTPPIQETGIGIDGEVQIEGAPSSDVIITISDETAQPGDTVCVDVTVENFNGLIGLEYEVAWDIGILDFIEVRDINLPDLSPASFSLINDTLKLSWVSFTSPQGVNVPDGTRIYSICFEVLGSTGQRSDVEFVTDVNVAKAGTPPIQETGIGIDGEVQIEGAPSSDVIITISDETAQPGDTVCVDVTVENFNGLIGLEYEVAWDIGILDFIEVRDINLPDLSPASFSLINDTLKLSWVSFTSPQGVNVPDGTRIYSICFEVLGSTGQRSDVEFVTDVNVAKAGTPPIQETGIGIDGEVQIEGAPSSDVIITISDETAQPGDTVCVDVTVENFNGLIGLEYEVAWDIGILDFIEVRDINLPDLSPASFSLINDTLKLSWVSFTSPQGVNVPDGTRIYSICFEVLGSTGQRSDVEFVTNVNVAKAGTPPIQETGIGIDGEVIISDVAPVQLFADCPEARNGEEVCIPLRVNDFNDIYGIQFSMAWDTSVLQYQRADNLNTIMNVGAGQINSPEPGSLIFLWDDISFTGITLADGDTLFSACMLVVGEACDSTIFDITDDPEVIEASTQRGLVGLIVPVVETDCQFKVGGCSSISITTGITNVSCFGGNDGAINIDPTGGTDPYSFQWGNNVPLSQRTNEDLNNLTADEYCVTVTDDDDNTATICLNVTQPAAAVTLDINKQDESCRDECDGTISLSASGGSGVYTYDWQDITGNDNPPNRTGLCADTYCVTVSDDKDCSVDTCIVIEPGILLSIIDTTIENAGCNGGNTGAITVVVGGGSGNYSYNWDPAGPNAPSRTGLAEATYCLTVTDNDNNCTIEECYEVEEAIDFTIVSSIDNVNCNGGQDGRISLTINGGSGDFSFDWAPPVTSTTAIADSLSEGDYTVTVTDDETGCTAVQTFTVTEPTALSVVVDSTRNVICNGQQNGAAFISVSGGTTPYTFEWRLNNVLVSNLQNPQNLNGGCYELTVIDDNNCTRVIGEICLGEPNPIEISVQLTNPTSGNNGAIDLTVTGGTIAPGSDYDYQWDNGLPNQPDHTGLAPGTYCVTVSDDNGCSVNRCFILACPLEFSIDSIVSPVCAGDSTGSIFITPSCGFPPYTYSWSNGAMSQDLVNVPSGTYFVTIFDTNNDSLVSGAIVINEPSAISIDTFIINPVTCAFDGFINITPVGGSGLYNYIWSNGETSEDIDSLDCNDFRVTITDQVTGCIFISPDYTVPCNPELPIITSIERIEPTCPGDDDGAINIMFTACREPVTFAWIDVNNPTDTITRAQNISNIPAGTYRIILTDDLDRIQTEDIVLADPDSIRITFTKQDEFCTSDCDECNGFIDVSVSGGQSPYMYQWNTTATSQDLFNLCADSFPFYSVTVTDINGCTAASENIVIEGKGPCVNEAIITDAGCPGLTLGSITLSTCDPGPYNYVWKQGDTLTLSSNTNEITGLDAGTYFVTLTDPNNPEDSATYNYVITGVDDWDVTGTVIDADTCNGGAIVLTVLGAGGDYAYDWSTGAMTKDITGLSPGEYIVTITDQNDCEYIDTFNVEGPACFEALITDEICVRDSNGAIIINTVDADSFSYTWRLLSDGTELMQQNLTNIPGGTYELIVRKGATIVFTETYVVKTLSFMQVALQIDSLPSCFGGNGQATVTAIDNNGPVSYQWCNGEIQSTANMLQSGDCQVTVMDSVGCEITREFVMRSIQPTIVSQLETCEGDCDGFLRVFPEGGEAPYRFLWSDSLGQQGEVAQELCAGIYTVTITDATNKVCIAEGTLNEVEGIDISFNITPATGRNGSVEAIPVGGQPPYTYLWGNGSTGSLITDLSVGEYTITIVDDAGCRSEATAIVEGDFGCRNGSRVITPLEDNFNDRLEFDCALEGVNNVLRIFNRWGQLVYEQENYVDSWNGTSNDGTELPEGGYFYVLEYDGPSGTEIFKGSVTIVR